MLAAIQGQSLVSAVIGLIVMGVIAGLLIGLVRYCGLPEPINKVANVIIAILVVVVLINFLLSIVGQPFINW